MVVLFNLPTHITPPQVEALLDLVDRRELFCIKPADSEEFNMCGSYRNGVSTFIGFNRAAAIVDNLLLLGVTPPVRVYVGWSESVGVAVHANQTLQLNQIIKNRIKQTTP